MQALGANDNVNAEHLAHSFKKACDLNNANGCFSKGMLLYEGKLVPQDYKQAFAYFEKGCKLKPGFRQLY